MNLSKTLFIIGLFITIIGFILQTNHQSAKTTKFLPDQEFNRQLDIAISKTKLNLVNPPKCNFNLGWCQISTKDINIAYISTQKDPIYQITALQKISTTAKMNHGIVQYIDLAGPRPYATLQNN